MYEPLTHQIFQRPHKLIRGGQFNWQNVSFTPRKLGVRVPYRLILDTNHYQTYNSVRQSVRLISVKSAVQICLGLLFIYKINFKSHRLYFLKFFEIELKKYFELILGFDYVQILNNKKSKKVITVIKSPHVNKKSKEQFEILVYSSTFFINVSRRKHKLILILVLKLIQELSSDFSITLEVQERDIN